MKSNGRLGLALLSLVAFSNIGNAATKGPYLGLGLGASRLETKAENIKDESWHDYFKRSRKTSGFGGRIFGGYTFNDYLGLEAGLTHYASSDTKATEVILNPISGLPFKNPVSVSKTYRLNTLDLVGKVYLPLSDSGVNLYALGGAALVRSTIDRKVDANFVTSSNDSNKKTQNTLRPKYGIGINYEVPDYNLVTGLELSRVQGKGNIKKDIKAIPNADMVTLNIAYKFD